MKPHLRRLLAGLLPILLCVGVMQAGDPASENRAAVCRELSNMAVVAQRHYYTPASRGGGGGAFDNSAGGLGISSVLQLTRRPTTPVGTYALGTVAATNLVLTGTGTAIGSDGNHVNITMTVFPDSTAISINN